MRILYLDCGAGVAGDMLNAALLDMGLDEGAWRKTLGSLGVAGVEVKTERVSKSAIEALFVDVRPEAGHPHRHLSDINRILDAADIGNGVRARAKAIFLRLGEAEAAVHGVPVETIHFHEVGAVDAIVDIVGFSHLLDAAGVERVVASPVRVGSGTVMCAHGEMPVPAPATARLLMGIPTFAGEVAGEFATPTGAACLAACVDAFGPQPVMRVEGVGYGAGKKDAPFPNCVRALVGVDDASSASLPAGLDAETVLEVECHVDDMTGESLAHLSGKLLDGPALEVTILPGVTKKSRPVHVVKVLAPVDDEGEVLRLLFRHSTTLGARCQRVPRVVLRRADVTVQTRFGPVRAKRTDFDGQIRLRPEYDDCARLAAEHAVGLEDVQAAARLGTPDDA